MKKAYFHALFQAEPMSPCPPIHLSTCHISERSNIQSVCTHTTDLVTESQIVSSFSSNLSGPTLDSLHNCHSSHCNECAVGCTAQNYLSLAIFHSFTLSLVFSMAALSVSNSCLFTLSLSSFCQRNLTLTALQRHRHLVGMEQCIRICEHHGCFMHVGINYVRARRQHQLTPSAHWETHTFSALEKLPLSQPVVSLNQLKGKQTITQTLSAKRETASYSLLARCTLTAPPLNNRPSNLLSCPYAGDPELSQYMIAGLTKSMPMTPPMAGVGLVYNAAKPIPLMLLGPQLIQVTSRAKATEANSQISRQCVHAPVTS
jgi:hypothetical protein